MARSEETDLGPKKKSLAALALALARLSSTSVKLLV
jgi:hypothetical protein